MLDKAGRKAQNMTMSYDNVTKPATAETPMPTFRLILLACAAATLAMTAAAHDVSPAASGIAAPPVVSPGPPKPVAAKTARDLTLSMIDLSSRHGAASPGAQGQLLAALIETARARHEELVALVGVDSEEVLRVAIPDGVRAALPPQAIPFLEEPADETGVLEVYHVDHVNPADDYYLHFLKTAKARFSLHFAGAAPDHITGASVRVRGVRIDSAIVLAAGDITAFATAAAALPNTLGAQRTLAILVNFSDAATQPYTVAYAQNVMFGTTSNYDYETSYQQTTLTGAVAGWFTIASSSTTCDYSTIASQAQKAAAAAGYVLSNYTRYVYVFPANACTWWGLGTVGGNPSQAWIHSKWGYTLPVIGHEMGHNFGLYHSHSMDCGAVSLDANTGNCTTSEYGDIFDMMGGGSNPPHFNAFQKERLGWLNAGVSPPLITVNPASGTSTYTIAPLENARDTTPRALKIARGGSCSTTSDWFYVEARQAKGFDAFLSSNTNVQTGVLVHLVTGGSANGSYLLDMTSATSSWSDPALVGGAVFTDPVSGLKIAPVSVGSAGATVNVTFGATSCTPAAPSITVTPTGTVWTAAGATTGYSMSVKNMDSCGCAATPFDVAAVVPTGWTSTTARTASIAPGSTTSSTLSVTTAAGAAPAFYAVTLRAVNDSAPTKVTAVNSTVAIASSLAVTASTDKTSYILPKSKNGLITATITTKVLSAGSPVSGAAVSVTVTDPAGKVATLSGSTGASGTVSLGYSMRTRTSTKGTYAVASKATVASMSSTATTSFLVQ
jgi:hypothetical protein